ncbi:heterokaryon incompatibility protein-domain-containing protein [Ustulina deusta]|nr:heterokaryon incompatibility protein-domain-containing protein [Ustulina deusta]
MSRHESFRAAGPRDLTGIIQFLKSGGLPDTQWSMADLRILRGYTSAWPHWNTPLHRMIATKQRDGVEYLLNHGASVDFRNYLGRTPLQEAARLEYHEGAELLLAHGAGVSIRSQGRSAGNEIGDHDDPAGSDVCVLPIHEAIKNADVRMIQILVCAGADVNTPSEGWQPLDLALIDRQVNVIDTLCELGASFSPIQQTEYHDQRQRKEVAEALLLAASHPDWFPPRSCHPLFVSVLATCNVYQYITTGSNGKQIINSDKLIYDFFHELSSIADRTDIEPAKDTLCSLCFQYQTLSTYPPCSCLDEDDSQTSADCFRHHDNLENLASSAKSGCRLCRVFLQALNLAKNHRSRVYPVLAKFLQRSTPSVFLHLRLPSRLFVTIGDLGAELALGYLDEVTIKQSPTNDDYEKGTSSLSSFQVAKRWLHNCITNHKACGHASVPLPTRVIDVGDGSRDPFLVESKGAHHNYCALSYCWGTSSNTHQTTTKNLERYYVAISSHELPRTLLDAIHASRAIGFKYIWIDALCIIQDDNDDWSREAIKMTQVYANATLTITTSVGDSSDDGLFRPHPDGFFNPQQLNVRLPKRYRMREQFPFRDTSLSVVRSTRPLSYLAVYPDANFPNIGFAYIGAMGSPVEKRAWTLQEHIFSKRVLYYGNGAILWECMELSASEHDPDGVRTNIQFPDRWKIKEYFHGHMASRSQTTSSSTDSVAPDSKALVPDKPFATYCRLLETYGNRLITKPSDRITAILGLGQVMQKVLGDEFIGGIWKGEHTLASLMWSIDIPSPKERARIFPTWS